MTKSDFLKKYPELEDDGEISKFKLSLLTNYMTLPTSKDDNKIEYMLEDYNSLVKSELRNQKINTILIEKIKNKKR